MTVWVFITLKNFNYNYTSESAIACVIILFHLKDNSSFTIPENKGVEIAGKLSGYKKGFIDSDKKRLQLPDKLINLNEEATKKRLLHIIHLLHQIFRLSVKNQ